MNILFVNDDYNLGGIQRVTKVIGENLPANYNTYYYSFVKSENYYNISKNFFQGNSLYSKYPLIRKINKLPRIVEQLCKGGQYSPHRYTGKALNSLNKFIEEKSINQVIMNGPTLTSFIPYLKKKNPQVKYIAWQHNNAATYINDYAKKYKIAYLQGLTEANHVVCLTDTDYEVYKKYNSKITRIYNPVTIKNDTLSSLNNKVISFAGRLVIQQKGIDYLIEIASKLPPDWKIVVAGTGDKHSLKEINDLVKKYNAEEKVVFQGPLDGEELNRHYQESSLYLMTSRWEGFGLVLVEAMSFGLPVLAFESTGADEILDYGRFGKIVKNGDVTKIINEINHLINNEEQRLVWQKKSVERVKDFSLDKIIPQWETILSRI